MPKKIAVVTGTRAEYGLLWGVLQEIDAHPDLRLQLIVSAAHLSAKHGMTIHQIKQDGFAIAAEVPLLDDNDDGDDDLAVARAVSRGVAGFAEAYADLKPDVVLVLGDRYEILAAAQAALLLHIPLAHIHGGEVTEGAMDEAIRHAISKMAALHFAAAEPYRQRLIHMGELPERVFTVGAPGLDVIKRLDLLDLGALQRDLQIALTSPLFLVTYHPVTWGDASGKESVEALFAALEGVKEATVIWTGANADAEGGRINAAVAEWTARTPLKVKFVTSLGSLRYLSLMAVCDAVVGNSSSGIIEAPALGVATVNIGPRQQGRLRAPSIIDCAEDVDSISKALETALSAKHRALCRTRPSVYGQGDTAQAIVRILAQTDFAALHNKPFYDWPVNSGCGGS
ncbi:UDP-N-acetylglucosamine 2-epimerase [Thiomicrorhabdus cannonii]|uniref:UDP-N-acetylglucosamine 2-epimerase n=1 Tax=Thiomicrorhabdus cannonii TaxID=2748011 RepID=UPI0015B99C09|nr:UDP-N-acetylglucosamine 2-epimerase [Thiomicrorhabdus cannonii]